MTSRVVRFLVFVLSIHLALPPAWCCYFTSGPCCSESAKPVEAKKKVKCCCCESEEAGETAAAKQAPKPAEPVKPCDSPCCVHEPTTLLDRDAGLDQVAIAVSLDAIMPLELFAGRVDFVRVGSDSISSLHVLHCRWLC